MTAFSGVRWPFSLWVLSAPFCEEIKAVSLWKAEFPSDSLWVVLQHQAGNSVTFVSFVSKFVFPITFEIFLLKIRFLSLKDFFKKLKYP